MKKALLSLGFVLLIAFFFFSWVMGSYNDLVVQDQNVKTGWSEVEVQYQRRFDLIPNFTAATVGYMAHEQKVFKDIADARANYAGASTPNAKVEATNGLEGALSRLLVVMEKYPELKADAQIVRLTDELAGTENRIQIVRSRYNLVASDFNKQVRVFPGNLIAKFFGFEVKELYASTPGAEVAPTVNLTIGSTH